MAEPKYSWREWADANPLGFEAGFATGYYAAMQRSSPTAMFTNEDVQMGKLAAKAGIGLLFPPDGKGGTAKAGGR